MQNGSTEGDGTRPPVTPETPDVAGGAPGATAERLDPTPEQQQQAQAAAETVVQEAQLVAQTRRSVERTYNTDPEHIRRVDIAVERSGKIAWLDIVDPVISEIPVVGEVAGVGIDLYVVGEALNAGVPAAEIVKMLGVVALEIIIALAIPVPVLDEVFPSNLICRWILRKYGDKIRAARARELGQPVPQPQAGPLPIGPGARHGQGLAPRRQLPPPRRGR